MFISKEKVSYPITFDNSESFIKRNLGIDLSETYDDQFISDLVESATELTEGKLNYDIAYTKNKVVLKDFADNEIFIDAPNYNSFISIVNNDTSTLITSYSINNFYNGFEIIFDDSFSCDSLTLNFYTGWDQETDVPKGLKQAIVCKVADLYDSEHSSYGLSSVNYNSTWERLCEQYKVL